MCGVTILFSSCCLERVYVPWQAYACISKCLHDMAGSITWGVIFILFMKVGQSSYKEELKLNVKAMNS